MFTVQAVISLCWLPAARRETVDRRTAPSSLEEERRNGTLHDCVLAGRAGRGEFIARRSQFGLSQFEFSSARVGRQGGSAVQVLSLSSELSLSVSVSCLCLLVVVVLCCVPFPWITLLQFPREVIFW